jgi:hypothetical protein
VDFARVHATKWECATHLWRTLAQLNDWIRVDIEYYVSSLAEFFTLQRLAGTDAHHLHGLDAKSSCHKSEFVNRVTLCARPRVGLLYDSTSEIHKYLF